MTASGFAYNCYRIQLTQFATVRTKSRRVGTPLNEWLGIVQLDLRVVKAKFRPVNRSTLVMAVATAMSRAPLRHLQLLETASALGQGKGWGAGTHAREVAAALQLLTPLTIENFCAIDAGANAGAWSAELLRQRPDSYIVAFEPSAEAAQRCRDRFRGNPRVEVIQMALGREPGTATLTSDSPGGVVGTLAQPRRSSETLDFCFQEAVTVVSLDEWVASSNICPSLLKMDVEGFELDVLAGATKLLSTLKVIQFEFGPANLRSRTYFYDYWELFSGSGFEMYILTPSGPRLVDRYSEAMESFRTTNFFAARS